MPLKPIRFIIRNVTTKCCIGPDLHTRSLKGYHNLHASMEIRSMYGFLDSAECTARWPRYSRTGHHLSASVHTFADTAAKSRNDVVRCHTRAEKVMVFAIQSRLPSSRLTLVCCQGSLYPTLFLYHLGTLYRPDRLTAHPDSCPRMPTKAGFTVAFP
jgi:hypothetical protein